MSNWLEVELDKAGIDCSLYYTPLFDILTAVHLDPGDKCEQLVNTFDSMGMAGVKAERVVRSLLNSLEAQGIESLASNQQQESLETGFARLDMVEDDQDVDKLGFRVDEDLGPLLEAQEHEDAVEDAYWEVEERECYNAMTAQELLQSIFVNLSLDYITQVLQDCHFSIDVAMEHLVSDDLRYIDEEQHEMLQTDYGNTYDSPVMPQETLANPQTVASRQVCRHFLLGQCYRADCWFSHDLEGHICKFWLQGRCLKGNACEFAHGQEIQRQFNNVSLSVNAPSNDHKDQAELHLEAEHEFPSLSAASPSKSNTDFKRPTALAYNDIAKKKSAASSTKNKPQKSLLIGRASATPTTKQQQSTEEPEATSEEGPGHTVKVSMPWVATGDDVASSYAEYRKDAIELAISRNKLFQQATEAYLSGNKAAARALSMSAKQLNDQVEQLHGEAAKAIFNNRNASLASTSVLNKETSNSQDYTIDLHGLHPTEAIDMLRGSLEKLKRRQFVGQVCIITGTGHHSRTNRAKVLPMVRQYLKTSGWNPKDATLEDGKGGLILIQMK